MRSAPSGSWSGDHPPRSRDTLRAWSGQALQTWTRSWRASWTGSSERAPTCRGGVPATDTGYTWRRPSSRRRRYLGSSPTAWVPQLVVLSAARKRRFCSQNVVFCGVEACISAGARMACRRVSGRGRRFRWPRRAGGVQAREARGLGEREGAQQFALAGGELSALLAGAGWAGERAEVQALQLVADVAPGVVGFVFDDADEQQRKPAEQDVCADAVLAAAVHRSQIEGALHVPPAALDLQQLLVVQRDVFGRQRRVA